MNNNNESLNRIDLIFSQDKHIIMCVKHIDIYIYAKFINLQIINKI